MYCGGPLPKNKKRVCNKKDCREKLKNSRVRKQVSKAMLGPRNKCVHCDNVTSTLNGLTCGSLECTKKQKELKSKAWEARQRENRTYPSCIYCGKETRQQGAKTCGSVACKKKYKSFLQKKERKEESNHTDAIAKLREYWGLKPLRSGEVACKRCGIVFHSEDIERRRHCPECRKTMSRLERGSIEGTYAYGATV